jgi:hypothetical protein
VFLFWFSFLSWFLAITSYFTAGDGSADSHLFRVFNNTHKCVRLAFPWKLLKCSPAIIIRELRDEVSENFENLSEKRDLIQRKTW